MANEDKTKSAGCNDLKWRRILEKGITVMKLGDAGANVLWRRCRQVL